MRLGSVKRFAVGALCVCALSTAAIAGAASIHGAGSNVQYVGRGQVGIPYYGIITSRRRSGPTFIVRPYGVPQYAGGPVGQTIVVGPTWMYNRYYR